MPHPAGCMPYQSTEESWSCLRFNFIESNFQLFFPAHSTEYIKSFPQNIQVSFTCSLPILYALHILPISSNQPSPSSSPENPTHPSPSSTRLEPERPFISIQGYHFSMNPWSPFLPPQIPSLAFATHPTSLGRWLYPPNSNQRDFDRFAKHTRKYSEE